MTERKQTVGVAETAAGGLVSAALLSVPGASAYYAGGLTLYTLASRLAFGGWTEADRAGYRGPTPEIVAGLAAHARTALQSTYAIGESGTAGPTGGITNRKPGYVVVAVVTPEGEVTRAVDTGVADRQTNMVRFAEEALKLLVEVLTAADKGKL